MSASFRECGLSGMNESWLTSMMLELLRPPVAPRLAPVPDPEEQSSEIAELMAEESRRFRRPVRHSVGGLPPAE